MSDLKRIQKLVKECLLADAEVLEPDHATVVYNQILKAFKAHIKGLPEPFIPMASNKLISSLGSYQIGFSDGAKDDRKVLMESLE